MEHSEEILPAADCAKINLSGAGIEPDVIGFSERIGCSLGGLALLDFPPGFSYVWA
jgi:hypothetical protein